MTFDLRIGDCREVLAGLEADSVDACVTDPPYELGFMGKKWDRTGVAFDPETWRAVYRVLKPGAHLLAFGGDRTHHRIWCAIEDAGFQIRHTLMWMYGSGFPKSVDVSKAIDKRLGAARKVIGSRKAIPGVAFQTNGPSELPVTEPATAAALQGWGTALKPGYEPIVLAKKPHRGPVAANVLKHGTGGLNVGACRVGLLAGERLSIVQSDPGQRQRDVEHLHFGRTDAARMRASQRESIERTNSLGRFPPNVLLTHSSSCERVGRRIVKGDPREGGEGHRQGGFADVGAPSGDRLPNGTLYGDQVVDVWACAPDCPVAELDRQSGTLKSGERTGQPRRNGVFMPAGATIDGGFCDGSEGGASRFFPALEWEESDFWSFRYVAKPASAERDAGLGSMAPMTRAQLTDRTEGSAGSNHARAGAGSRSGRRNFHPTVKPVALMAWLCRLVTPPGGLILDPFAGSGTTLMAATRGGFRAVGIELDEKHAELARLRVEEDSPLFHRSGGG